MIDFSITGTIEEEILEFTIDGKTKSIDQFTPKINFALEDKGVYRIFFEQKIAKYIPEQIDKAVNILLMPIKGLFDILTFNVDSKWEEKISAFRVSGYIDINIESDTEITFQYTAGHFNKSKGYFDKPIILFSNKSKCEVFQQDIADDGDIKKKYYGFVQNVISVSMWFYILFGYLFIQSISHSNYTALIILLSVIIFFSVLIGVIFSKASVKKKKLILILKTMN